MLETTPLLFCMAGLALYAVLAGADFGAGLWQLAAGRGHRARSIRDHAHHAIAPVWEANHVWLIFVLTVGWTAYPLAITSVATTLTIPISVAALGIVFRGLAYAMQSATDEARQRRVIDSAFALSSILTPFMLGATLGAVASGRVPVGNAAGNLITSWVNPSSMVCGVLAVATGALLAAVYLAADADRLGKPEMVEAFRIRALVSGLSTGVLAVIGLLTVNADANRIFRGLTSGYGLIAVIVSATAGLGTVALAYARHFRLARASAALSVAAILAGWAAAQRPILLPGLTLAQAAAGSSTMVWLIVAVIGGGLILAPALALLFRLVLLGEFDVFDSPATAPVAVNPAKQFDKTRSASPASVSFLVGVLLLTIATPEVAHIVGALSLLVSAVLTFNAVAPTELASSSSIPVA